MKKEIEKILSTSLPLETNEKFQIKDKGSLRQYRMVTVLFSNIQGFTEIAEQTNGRDVIDELGKVFMCFDSVVEKYNLVKIKIAGGSCICAGGIPDKNRTNPIDIILAAMEIQKYFNKMQVNSTIGNDFGWGFRIGIHTGSVITGIIDAKKMSYDIWGDTVNIANRLQSLGTTGKINISGMTYMLIRDFFICEYQGKILIKNKETIDMYHVKGFKPSLSRDLKGLVPNEHFQIRFQLLRYDDLEEVILTKLENELSKNLYYHNLKHTVDVVAEVEIIGRKEGVADSDILLLKTAALFHDTGFILSYDEHEKNSIKIARHILPQYHYSPKQIDTISNLIMITQFPPKPKNQLENIMCDADLDYLGRTDFIAVSGNLYRELHEHGHIGSIDEWNRRQIKFIQEHTYFTETAQKMRDVNKQKQLEKLRELL